jgi:hypothetical protein
MSHVGLWRVTGGVEAPFVCMYVDVCENAQCVSAPFRFRNIWFCSLKKSA